MIRMLALLLAVAACAEDVRTLEVPPRPVPWTQSEIAFASATLNALQGPSFAQNREFCGLIGITPDGRYTATPARRGNKTSCLPPFQADGMTVLASYHTHGGYTPAYAAEVPSYDDLRTDIEDGTDGYVSTPGGRFWFVDARAKEVRLLCGPGCLATDPNFLLNPEDPVFPRYSLEELAKFY